MDAYAAARARIDQAHSLDPKRTPDGAPAELVYADRIEAWVTRLVASAPPHLILAARCQHLERWSVPRASFPLDKQGYHAWRKTLYRKQAERCRELLLEAGVPLPEADEAAGWVSKTGLKTNTGTQALEDAACLVFLEHELPGFAETHADYTKEKYIDILQKTWRKMSPAARQAALSLPLAQPLRALVVEAVGALGQAS
jgi:tRNAThr (cytosine32-N3)-methyltransferase